MKKRIVSACMIIVMTLALYGGAYLADRIVVKGEDGHFTYSYAAEDPITWNPLEWESEDSRSILEYTGSPLYVSTLNDTRDAYTYEPMLATALPEDVTPDYIGNEVYGVPDSASQGWAWRVTIREDAAWEDGTAITTDDFVYSLQQYLNPEGLHKHTADYYAGTTALANAKKYIHNSMEPVYTKKNGAVDVDESKLFISLSQPNEFFGEASFEEYHAWNMTDHKNYFCDVDGSDLYEKMESYIQGQEYVPVDDTIKTLLMQFCSNIGLDVVNYKNACFYYDEANAISWDQIGLIQNDKNTMTFVLNSNVTQDEFCLALENLYLVKSNLYEKKQNEYGTGISSYSSYGPYKISEYDSGIGMRMVKNENWFGYKDKKYDNQYQTTDIWIRYDLDYDKEKELFLQGNLQRVRLNQIDTEKYGKSPNYAGSLSAEIAVFNLNSDLAMLQKKNSDSENHNILAYKDFRNAMAMALDRRSYMAGMNYRAEAVYGMVNSSYIGELGSNSSYRQMIFGQAALQSIYNTQDTENINAYDMERAAKLVQSAYDMCLMDGNIKDYENVVLTFYSEDQKETIEKDLEYIQNALDMASVGTSLENRIKVKSVQPDKQGKVEADISKEIWNGNIYDVSQTLQKYCDKDSGRVYGLHSQLRNLTIELGGKKITKTFTGWYESLMNGKYRATDLGTRLTIFMVMEQSILKNYTVIPFYSEYEDVLYADRIEPGSNVIVNARIKNGGIRYMGYKMDDAEWAKYCMDHNCELEDLLWQK